MIPNITDEDAWHLALVQVLGSYATDPDAAKASAWQLVASAPPALSLGLAHTLQVVVAMLGFEIEGRYETSADAPFELAMVALGQVGVGRSSALTALAPHMLARRQSTDQPNAVAEVRLEELAALARDRQVFSHAQDAWWPTFLLADSLALANRLEAALHAGYHSLALAQACKVVAYQDLSRTVVGYILLSMDDAEGALAVLESSDTAGQYGKNLLKSPLLNNHLLALLLAGHLPEAAALMAQHPQFDAQALERRLGLRSSMALLHLSLGQAEQALALLGPASAVRWSLQHKAAYANRCWIRARTLLALGRYGEAVEHCQQGLRDMQAQGFTLSPLNRAQIYKAASEGLALLGDPAAAAAAALQAQNSELDWLQSATRARLVGMSWRPDVAPQAQLPKLGSVALLEQLARTLPQAAQAGESGADNPGVAANLRMVAQVSHEMRNPIAGVLGMTSLLQGTDLDDKQRRYLSLARSSAEMLLSLCNDLLDMAQLDNGRFALRPALCDLGAASDQACQIFAPHIASKGITLQLGIDHAALRAWVCDEMRFKQVLMNLVSNAVKFTPRGGQIAVRVRLLTQLGCQVLAEVQDSGSGITALEQQRLFQDFSQLPNHSEHRSPDMAAQGAGLGLALCRRLVQQMQGEMGLRSTVGAGATFWFTMPVLDEAAAAAKG